MREIIVGGIARDLTHLTPLLIDISGKGKEGRALRVRVLFGLHVISRSCGPGGHDMYDEQGKPRQFNEERYAFSLGLPELARRMIEQNYFCWQSADRNRALNYAVIDVAPGRVRTLRDGVHRVIFFYLYPADEEADVNLVITSCHSRDVAFGRIKRRYNIHMLLRMCLYNRRRIP